jgi:hypothetical protein
MIRLLTDFLHAVSSSRPSQWLPAFTVSLTGVLRWLNLRISMQRAFSLSYLTCLDAPPPSAIRTAASTGYNFVGLRLLPAMPGGIAHRLIGRSAAASGDLLGFT